MQAPGVGRCPVCGAFVPIGPRCELCLVPLKVERDGRLLAVHPLIRPGDVLASRDLTREPLPGEKQRSWSRADGCAAVEDGHGIVLHVPGGETRLFIETWVRVRDCCVRSAFMCFDPYAQYGVMLRREPIGDGARTFYSLDVQPGKQSVRLARCFSTKTEAGAHALFGWAQLPCIAPPGHPNEVELRAQGTAIEAWVNGTCVIQLHDPVLGIGWTGMRVAPIEVPAGTKTRVLCRGFEVRAVAV
jgi:hypothetical protein